MVQKTEALPPPPHSGQFVKKGEMKLFDQFFLLFSFCTEVCLILAKKHFKSCQEIRKSVAFCLLGEN